MTKFQKTYGMSANGTCLQDYMVASYSDLVEVFGEPTYEDDTRHEKVNFEWVLTDGENVVTIYNWKDYDGGTTAMSSTDYEWHIGGRSKMSAWNLQEFFQSQLEKVSV